jgi:hypothetical protein
MALSNLMGMEITPWVLARDVLKATPDYDSNLGLYYLTLSGRGIDDTGKVMDMNKGTLAASINEVYGSYGVQAKAITITQATVDEILEKGGMVVASFKNNGLSWYTGKSSHFIVIRSKDSNGLYYPLDSNVSDSKAVARMTDGQQWSTVYNALNYYPALAIWVEGGSANTGNTNTGSTGTGGVQTVTVPSGSNYTMDQVNADIAAGKYTKEDLDYMAALINESSSYEGCLAVASVVANRAKAGNTSIKSVVTASGQFAGYSSADVGRYSNTNLFNASVAILRGDASSVVGNCRYFFGRINGWDVWAENGAGLVYNIGGNVFYSTYGTVHNKSSASHTIDQTIYSASQSKWLLNSGQSKVY